MNIYSRHKLSLIMGDKRKFIQWNPFLEETFLLGSTNLRLFTASSLLAPESTSKDIVSQFYSNGP
jgi:hypothetical protein